MLYLVRINTSTWFSPISLLIDLPYKLPIINSDDIEKSACTEKITPLCSVFGINNEGLSVLPVGCMHGFRYIISF